MKNECDTNFYTVVGERKYQYNEDDFRMNFNFYQAFIQHGYTQIWKQREAVNLKKLHFNYL